MSHPPNATEIVCPDCKGDRVFVVTDEFREYCRRCNGEGTVPATPYHNEQAELNPHTEE